MRMTANQLSAIQMLKDIPHGDWIIFGYGERRKCVSLRALMLREPGMIERRIVFSFGIEAEAFRLTDAGRLIFCPNNKKIALANSELDE